MPGKRTFKQSLGEAFDWTMYQALRRLPLPITSAIGAPLGAFAGRITQKGLHRRADGNLARLRPGLDAGARDALLRRRWRHIGRTMTEFGHLHRLIDSGRISIAGDPTGRAALSAEGPRLVAGLHLGNWEAIGPVIFAEAGELVGPYQPPSNAVRHRIAVVERARYGARAFPPGRASAMAIARVLAGKGAALLYLDEVIDKRRRGPVWRGAPPEAGNIHAVARLAVRFGATVIPADCLRTDGARFTVTLGAPLRPDPAADKDLETRRIAAALNTFARDRITANPEQWLMLHERPPPG